jgi:endoglycosylceramidase
MSGGLWLVLAIVALGTIVLSPLPTLAASFQPERPPAGSLPWLSVRGGQIVNSRGDSVILRGFNDDALLQSGREPLPPPLTMEDALLMRAQGFDVVRIPVSWSLLEPRPGTFSRSYLAQVEAMVALCARAGLYTVLDLHTEDFGVAFGGSGAPSWLTLPALPDWHFPGVPSAWQRHLSPAVNADLAFFWLYPNWQRLYWRAWQVLARPLAGDSAVAGFDLYNEPHPLPVPPGIFAPRILFPFYATGIRKIAQVDPNHLFIIEGDLFGDLPTRVDPLRAPDLVYSTHLYAGSLIGGSFHGQSSSLRSELAQGLSEAAQMPAPYWTGELGIDHQLRGAKAWALAEIALSDQYRTGWAWWQWDDPAGWGVRTGHGPVDRAWLDTLSQPFVQAAPGRLLSMAYSTSRQALTVRFARVSSPAVADVAWPASLPQPRVGGGCAQLAGAYPGGVRVLISKPDCTVTLAS